MAPGGQEGAGLDAVGDHPCSAPWRQLGDPDDDEPRCRALDARARLLQLAELGDLGFEGAVVKRRHALGEHRGHQHVAGAPTETGSKRKLTAAQPRAGPPPCT